MTPRPVQPWGPITPPRRRRRWWPTVLLLGCWMLPNQTVSDIAIAVVLIVLVLRAPTPGWLSRWATTKAAATQTPAGRSIAGVQKRGTGGVLLGVDDDGGWRQARQEAAVLVLGPPRSGKSSGVVIPSVLAWRGPLISTSTKPDILYATAGARSQLGRVWEFEPTGHTPDTGRVLRWSPVTSAHEWDGAVMMARAMVTGAGVGAGTTDSTHWVKRAGALLAPLLHAAAVSGASMSEVVEWVLHHDLDPAGHRLSNAGSTLALQVLTGLASTEARERSSIFSAAADALEAYTSHAALTAASDPNFDAAHFVSSQDAIYIHAPAEHQAQAAPLVCGLLAEIRRATYHAHATRALPRRVLFALDEAANIAPIAELPQLASEAGSQGLTVIAAFQDLSQARHRWGTLADGFLTVFSEKVIFAGIADTQTLESISVALGEYDRPVTSTTRQPTPATADVPAMLLGTNQARTTSIQRQRVLSPGEIANIPAGHTLHLTGLAWEKLALINAHRDQPWQTILTTPPAGRTSAPENEQ